MPIAISVDKSTNVFVTGGYNGQIAFASDTLNSYSNQCVFIAKYDSLGNPLWGKSSGTTGYFYEDGPSGMGLDEDGNIYIAGYFSVPLISFDSLSVTNEGSQNGFVVKFNNNGKALWVKQFGGAIADEPLSMAVDKIGNSYVSGIFLSDSIIFGTDTFYREPFFNTFIFKMDSAGVLRWADQAGGDMMYLAGVAIDTLNGVYLTGTLYGTNIPFDSVTIYGDTAGGLYGLYLVKYDTAGNALWGKAIRGNNEINPRGITTDYFGNIYVTGAFVCAEMEAATDTLFNQDSTWGEFKMFIVKYDGCKPYSYSPIIGSDFICQGAHLTLFDSSTEGIWTLSNTNASINSQGLLKGLEPGVDTVFYTTGGMCQTATVQTIITVYPSPNPGTISGLDTLCVGHLDTLSETATGIWSLTNPNDSLPTSGVFFALASGIDTVIYSVSNSYGCIGKAILPVTVHSKAYCDSINYVPDVPSTNNSVSIYPNPATSVFYIDNGAKNDALFTLYDSRSCKILSQSLSNNSTRTQIICRNLPEGLYFYEIDFSDKSKSRGMIVLE